MWKITLLSMRYIHRNADDYRNNNSRATLLVASGMIFDLEPNLQVKKSLSCDAIVKTAVEL